eukprot:TRINITY_DN17218_c0_g1_i1.p1 TRINITY_DN17218_c0_g1~~TRINITY_DN17218_c0_g1_i1.p1  ORF type:complete len:106 (-),score=27.47 TRINITY_DN17218_c0_g1_i1:334-651(-)
MNLSCLACHGADSPSTSFRGHSGSDAESEGRCGAALNCWMKKSHTPPPDIPVTSRVAPQPFQTTQGPPGSPRLVRCHAVRRDIFRDWHFDDATEESPRALVIEQN